jgi:hypothetical protein
VSISGNTRVCGCPDWSAGGTLRGTVSHRPVPARTAAPAQ